MRPIFTTGNSSAIVVLGRTHVRRRADGVRAWLTPVAAFAIPMPSLLSLCRQGLVNSNPLGALQILSSTPRDPQRARDPIGCIRIFAHSQSAHVRRAGSL